MARRGGHSLVPSCFCSSFRSCSLPRTSGPPHVLWQLLFHDSLTPRFVGTRCSRPWRCCLASTSRTARSEAATMPRWASWWRRSLFGWRRIHGASYRKRLLSFQPWCTAQQRMELQPLRGCQLTKLTRLERHGCIQCRLGRARSAALQLPPFLLCTYLSDLPTTRTLTAQGFVLLSCTVRYRRLHLLPRASPRRLRAWRFLHLAATRSFD